MAEKDRDRRIERIADVLRQPVPADPGARARLMGEIEGSTGGGHRGAGRRTRWGRVAGGAIAAAAAAALVLYVFQARPDAERRPVRFVFEAQNASRIALVGDFNDWDPDATPLSASGDGGPWTTVLRLQPGAYRYAFLVDDHRWAPDPLAPRAPGNDFGIPSSLVLVPGSGT